MIDVAVLRALAAAGATTEMIIAAVEAAQAVEEQKAAEGRKLADEKAERRRELAAARQKRFRERHPKTETRVTQSNALRSVVTRYAPPPERPSEPSSEPLEVSQNPHPPSAPKGASVTPSPAGSVESALDQVRAVYPRRTGGDPKKPALEVLGRKLRDGHDLTDIVAGAAKFARSFEGRSADDRRFIPQLAKWLRNEEWVDLDGPPKSAEAGGPKAETLRRALATFRETGVWPAGLGPPPEVDFPDRKPSALAPRQLFAAAE